MLTEHGAELRTDGRWRALAAAFALACGLSAGGAQAGAQRYEPLSDSVRSALAAALVDRSAPEPRYASTMEKVDWLAEMSARLPVRHKPTHRERVEFLQMVRYEAQRAFADGRGVSRLSPYVHFGQLSPRLVMAKLKAAQ